VTRPAAGEPADQSRPRKGVKAASPVQKDWINRPSSMRSVSAVVIPRASLADWLAGVLRERILDGAYPGGQRLREVALQQEFSVSNGPIREALQLLAADGLVVRNPRRGVCVIDLSPAELLALFEMRLGLFELAAELAARRVSPDFTAKAVPLMAEMREAAQRGDVEAQMPLGHRFSLLVCESSGNAELLQAWHRLMLRLRLAIYKSLINSDLPERIGLCGDVLDGIAAGDAAAARGAARRLMLRHMRELELATVL
jgi:DNA-binding GntR family transcriptional regulator